MPVAAHPEETPHGGQAPAATDHREHQPEGDQAVGSAPDDTATAVGDQEEVDLDPEWTFPETCAEKYDAMRAEVRMSIYYHDHLEAWHGRLENLVSVASTFLGSGAIVGFFVDSMIAAAGGLVVGVLQGLEQIFKFGARRANHMTLKRQYIGLLGRMESERATRDAIKRWNLELLDLEAQDEPVKRTLMLLCHNELAIRINQHDQVIPVGWFRSMMAPMFDLRFDRLVLAHHGTGTNTPAKPKPLAALEKGNPDT
jgi:hypothetical protein